MKNLQRLTKNELIQKLVQNAPSTNKSIYSNIKGLIVGVTSLKVIHNIINLIILSLKGLKRSRLILGIGRTINLFLGTVFGVSIADIGGYTQIVSWYGLIIDLFESFTDFFSGTNIKKYLPFFENTSKTNEKTILSSFKNKIPFVNKEEFEEEELYQSLRQKYKNANINNDNDEDSLTNY